MYGEILLADLRNTKGAISELPQSMTASHESDKHGNVWLGLLRQNYHNIYNFTGYNINKNNCTECWYSIRIAKLRNM